MSFNRLIAATNFSSQKYACLTFQLTSFHRERSFKANNLIRIVVRPRFPGQTELNCRSFCSLFWLPNPPPRFIEMSGFIYRISV